MQQRSMQPLHANRALAAAKPLSHGWPLRFAIASRTSVWLRGDGQQVFVPEEWLFTFAQSASAVVTVRVARSEVGLAPHADVEHAHNSAPPDVATYPEITGWRIDSDKACAIAEANDGHLMTGSGPFGGVGLLQLRMAYVDGRSRPLWWLPHRREFHPLFICADTGALASISDAQHMLFTSSGLGTLDAYTAVRGPGQFDPDIRQPDPGRGFSPRMARETGTAGNSSGKRLAAVVVVSVIVLGMIAMLTTRDVGSPADETTTTVARAQVVATPESTPSAEANAVTPPPPDPEPEPARDPPRRSSWGARAITELTEEERDIVNGICHKVLEEHFRDDGIVNWYRSTLYYLPASDEEFSSAGEKLDHPIDVVAVSVFSAYDRDLAAQLRAKVQDLVAVHQGRRFHIEECVVRITPGGGGGSMGATSDMVIIVPTRVRIE